jgi:hypothetical protein
MASNAEIRQWARDRGVQVSERGRVSDQLRAEYESARPGSRLPTPDEVAEDIGVIDIGDDDLVPDEPQVPLERAAPPAPPEDEPPPHARREWRQRPSRAKAKSGTPRITVSIRSDIEAKVGLMLAIPGEVWAVRDPVCGGMFMGQRGEIAGAFTDIICESPDLVAFFTGPGGSFMRWFRLAAACYPVASMVMAHHVYHSLDEAGGPAKTAEQYAA